MTDLTQAIALMRRVCAAEGPWEAEDFVRSDDLAKGLQPGPVDKAEATILNAAASGEMVPATEALQARVWPWMLTCFGEEVSRDKEERGDRLLEEVFELLQSGGYDPARVLALRDYVWSRDVGEPAQEVGGVMITLAAYCLAHDLDMHKAGETELARIWTKVEKIRAKQAAKPKGGALPQEWPVDLSGELIPLADHKLAVAEAYRKAAGRCLAMSVRVAALDNDNYGDPREYAAGLLEAQHEAILALADTDALAELQALRDERDRLDAVTNTLSEMWEGEQTARHSAEAELATLQRENAILRSNARAQGLVEEIGATGKSRRKETGNLARIITNQRAELRKQAGELATLRAAEKELSDAYLRIREKLGAWNTAHGGADRFAVTEAAVDALRAQVERLTAKLALVQRALEKADEGLEYMGLYAPALTEGAAP